MIRVALLLVAAGVTSCAGTSDPAEETDASDTDGLGLVVDAPDGSKRVPFLDGAFVTNAPEMPVEVEQAVLGLPTDRPVVVWAGLDRDVATSRADRPER